MSTETIVVPITKPKVVPSTPPKEPPPPKA